MDYKQFFANTPEEFFGTLLQSITEGHKAHLKTGKYSDHMALNEFYDEMTELVDALIEHYQGINGKIEEYNNNFQEAQFDSAIEYLEALRDFTRDGREKFCKESELQSCADDVLNQIDSTLYKLKELGESKKSEMRSLTEFLKESLNEGISSYDDFVDAITEWFGENPQALEEVKFDMDDFDEEEDMDIVQVLEIYGGMKWLAKYFHRTEGTVRDFIDEWYDDLNWELGRNLK